MMNMEFPYQHKFKRSLTNIYEFSFIKQIKEYGEKNNDKFIFAIYDLVITYFSFFKNKHIDNVCCYYVFIL